ncbi:hypothetical protein STVIR_6887 [Streptomyces viridochromogenes Tue57]|uniref:Uncharacterized protein n=1 Tax=Streptomyces viridochromogenes Tue57 TaxID=1160705 RepID=L8P9R3_STRVR|nr:hypothetical protein STVIR_6887 [Streptomyces viridochromogenes Tue57]
MGSHGGPPSGKGVTLPSRLGGPATSVLSSPVLSSVPAARL